MLHGVDVSNHNGQVTISGKDFAIMKATEGTGFVDPLFPFFWAAAKEFGMLRGAYLFMDPVTDPKAQAELFVNTVKSHGLTGMDMLCLDAEETTLTNEGIIECVKEIEALSGKNVVVYTMYSMIRLGRFNGLYNQPLWIANPGGPVGAPPSVKPWPTWTMQQYSWDIIDQNVFNGDKATWEKIVNVKAPMKLLPPTDLTQTEKPVVAFNWKFVEGAAEYQLQVMDKAGKVVHDAMVPHSESNVVLEPATNYTWRVKSSPNGEWSAASAFETR